ncbi:MAG: LysM domain-containing protein, partial [Candidatus Hydrogenedentota bacterium]
LTDSRLQVGNELKVYRGPGAETIEAAKPATTTYQVKKGDTLTQIARRFGVTPQDILNANNLDDPNKVIVGQRLTIPVKE